MAASRVIETKPVDPSAPGEPLAGACRRLHRRMTWGKPVALAWLRPDGSLTSWVSVTADDVSLGGMGLSGMLEFRPGAVGVVELPSSDGGRALVGVQVIHVERLTPTSEAAGVRFVPLSRSIVERSLVRPVDSVAPSR